MTIGWLNGEFFDEGEGRICITDRGFTLGDGIFETIKAVGTTPFWLSEHFERLSAGATQLGLTVPFSESSIRDTIHQLLARFSKGAESAVRLTITRGPTAARGLWPNGVSSQPTCLLTVAPTTAPVPQHFIVCRSTRRNEHSPLSSIKSLNYGDNILARREAIGRGVEDALMLNTKGHVASATVGNVFFRIAGGWITPSLADGILSGLARRRFIAELGAVESSVSIDAVMKSDAGFVCNSLGCTPIRSVDGHVLPGDLTALPISSVYLPS